MATDISMASNALLLIGDSPINALSESQSASNLYSETYEYVLTRHPWSFSMKEQYLSKLTQAPDRETGYTTAFQMPTDCIRIWAIFPTIDYRIVGQLVYSNSSKLLARYTYKVDESQLPAHFVKCMEYKLAADFAISVAEDQQKSQLFEQKFEASLSTAMASDSQQHPFPEIKRNPIRLGRGRR